MDFVDKQNVALVQIGQDRRQIAGPFDRRPRGHADVDPHLGRDHVRQRSLAQAGRAIEQDMLQRLLARTGSVQEDAQPFLDLFLAQIVVQVARAQSCIGRNFAGL